AGRARPPVPSPLVLPSPARRAAGVALGAATAAGVVHRVRPLRRHLVPEVCFGAGAGLALGAVGYAAAVRLWGGVRRGGRGGSCRRP
ncbi:DUF4184 family protein, partial [Kitasatospora sp. NPDC004240]